MADAPPDALPETPRYQSLYRRHRPVRFGEIIGQDHVTTALRNAVTEGRVGHAYLFSGPRGTGKTTTARLLAKAVNCLNLGPDGEPCLECENCRAVAASEFYDLIELDAASNRGVDAMRELIQNVNLGLGASALRKVYVIDEVHMLTGEAGNTLLKTLEEPPAHVLFVLATTEPGKVLPTIRSRTQHFEFSLLSLDELKQHITSVLKLEDIAAEPEAVELVARRASGSARDALSLLDQAIALSGGSLDTTIVQEALGGTAHDDRLRILEAAAAHDAAGAIVALDATLQRGVDPRRLADELLATLRDAFLIAASRGRVIPEETTTDDVGRLTTLGEEMGMPAMVRGIDTLGQTIVDVRGPAVPDPRLSLEVAVLRIARREAGPVLDALVERVSKLEAEVESLRGGGAVTAPAVTSVSKDEETTARAPEPAAQGGHLAARLPRTTTRAKPAAKTAPEPEPEPEPDVSIVDDPADAVEFTLDDAIAAWPSVLDSLAPPVRALVDVAQPIAVDDGVLVFGTPAVHIKRVNAKFRENAEAIKQAFRASIGCAPKLKIVEHDGFASDPVSALVEADDSVYVEDPTDAGEPLPPPVDIATKLTEEFGAQVVDETQA